MFNIIIGYKVHLKEYQDFNIIICQIIYTIYKSYFKSERRKKHTNMLTILYQDLLTIEKYFSNQMSSKGIIQKFIKSLKEII